MKEKMVNIIGNSGSEIQVQIDDMNRKLDSILEELAIQRQKRQAVEDLATDLNIIGNDLFKATVDELDHAGVELDAEELKSLFFRFLRNAGTINEMLQMAESLVDLSKDIGPVVTQIGLDGIQKMHELEKRGYFEFLKELPGVFDNIVKHFSTEDVKLLAENIVSILETIKNLTQPEMLDALNNAINVFKKIEIDNVEEYSLWKAFREIMTPEGRRGLGFIMTFLKNITKDEIN
jgi:uncharacterized protein YjgD (DUF1641 family)